MTFQIELAEDMIWSLDPMDRVRVIGSGIEFGGEEYLRTHPTHLQELADQGFTPEQAVAEYRSRMAEIEKMEWHDGRNNGQFRARVHDVVGQRAVVE